MKQKLPFLYRLIRTGPDDEDLLFKRLRGEKPVTASALWALHPDIEDPGPAAVLIFVSGKTRRQDIMDEINKAQTFFREQIEPHWRYRAVSMRPYDADPTSEDDTE